MVWLYLPPEAISRAQKGARCLASRSARAQAGSTSASISPRQDIELFVTSSGKATPQPLSWRGWKTRPWIARLSGTTLRPSTAKRGAAWWISSTAAIHASRSPSLGASSATKTHAISGRTSRGSSAKSNRQFVSLKTSVDIYDWDLNKSTMTFDQWVIALRRACLQRQKLARRTSASGSSSWLTPRAQESGEKQDTFLKRNGDRTDRCFGSLTAQSALWPTPRAHEPGSTSLDHGISLTEASKYWPTPRACTGKRSSGLNRSEMMRQWATPTARDWKDGVLVNSKAKTRSNLSRQAPRTRLGGSAISNAPRTLNPLFVEALMGWPTGWTGSDFAATAWFRWSRLMRFALWQLKPSKNTDQHDLFNTA